MGQLRRDHVRQWLVRADTVSTVKLMFMYIAAQNCPGLEHYVLQSSNYLKPANGSAEGRVRTKTRTWDFIAATKTASSA